MAGGDVRRPSIGRAMGAALLVLACAASLFQTVRATQWASSMLTRKVLVNWRRETLSRGADAAYGEAYMRFVESMRSAVPEGARVIQVGRTGRPQFESVWYLQYFLFPRQVEACGLARLADCIARAAAEPSYFLVSGAFTDRAAWSADFEMTSLGDELTLLSPREREGQ